MKIPHPFPYQGSKRALADTILNFFPDDVSQLIEPFCGAAAISIAAAQKRKAESYLLNDKNRPLIDLWNQILHDPDRLTKKYSELWHMQMKEPKSFFLTAREKFNATYEPHLLLFLLARIVKGAVRYSSEGKFNQSPDNRRLGMNPERMLWNLKSISGLMRNKTKLTSFDFTRIFNLVTDCCLVYMDPPYQGTSFTRDHRYSNGVQFNEFCDFLAKLNNLKVSYIISYDGATGEKVHGQPLPKSLELKHLHLAAGRSAQSTLLGVSEITTESLYLSKSLLLRLQKVSGRAGPVLSQQTKLL